MRLFLSGRVGIAHLTQIFSYIFLSGRVGIAHLKQIFSYIFSSGRVGIAHLTQIFSYIFSSGRVGIAHLTQIFSCIFSSGRVGIAHPTWLLFIFYLCGAIAHAGEVGDNIKLSPDRVANLGITLGKLSTAAQIPVLYAPAKVTIPPQQDYVVSASQAGLINQLHAAIGDKVKKGAVLAELNSPDLLTMQQLYLRALSEVQLSAFSYQRDKKLLEDGVIANRRWQETQSQYNAFVSEVTEHEQLLLIAGMTQQEINTLGKTRKLVSALNVHSPINGVVIERMVVAGERVNSLAPLYRIGNLDELWLEVNMPQERVNDVKVGDKVLIDNSDAHAVITLMGQSVNTDNQTVLARAVIKGAQTSIRVGQKINVQIIHANEQAAFSLPDAAIAQHEGKSFVFLRTQDGFSVQAVNVIGRQGNVAIVRGNFTGNEAIAVTGAVALKANWLGLGSE